MIAGNSLFLLIVHDVAQPSSTRMKKIAIKIASVKGSILSYVFTWNSRWKSSVNKRSFICYFGDKLKIYLKTSNDVFKTFVVQPLVFKAVSIAKSSVLHFFKQTCKSSKAKRVTPPTLLRYTALFDFASCVFQATCVWRDGPTPFGLKRAALQACHP